MYIYKDSKRLCYIYSINDLNHWKPNQKYPTIRNTEVFETYTT